MAEDHPTRAVRAKATRHRVLSAARQAFLADGYAGTTIRQVAAAADVSPETIYKRFGSKAGLFKDVYDVAMAGDEEPVPIAQRPQVQAVRAATNPASSATAYAHLAGAFTRRAGALIRLALSARGSDPDLDAFVTTIDHERLTGSTMAVREWAERGWLRPGLDVEQARDIVWTLNSPALWALLAARGWTLEAYQAWLAEALLSMVLASGDQPPSDVGH